MIDDDVVWSRYQNTVYPLLSYDHKMINYVTAVTK
jgi:hypothetical protein